MSNDLEPLLWVIQFNSREPQVGERPAITYFEPGDMLMLPPQMSDAMAVQFLERMQLFFQQVIDTSRDRPLEEEEVNLRLDDLTRNLELLQEWMKSFQKFLKNPDDLTGNETRENT